MKHVKSCLRLAPVILFCISSFVTAGSASAMAGGNRCKDRCNDAYRRHKNECRGLRRGEKRRCEDQAKSDRDDCRRHCR